jgi:sec-independent protein translocase protein TatB
VNLDPDKLVVLFVIALLVLGPKRLPEIARTAGRWMAEVRKYTSVFQTEIKDVLEEPRRHTSALRDEFHSAIYEPRQAIEAAAREATREPVATTANPPADLNDVTHAGPSTPEISTGIDISELTATGANQPVTAQGVPDDPDLN